MKKLQRAPYNKEDSKIRKHIRLKASSLKKLMYESKKQNKSFNYIIELIIDYYINKYL